MRSLILAVLVALAGPRATAPAQTSPLEACARHIPFGAPASTDASRPLRHLCRSGYAVGHDGSRRQPAWVAERLTARSAWGCSTRDFNFSADTELKLGERSEQYDYTWTRWSRGHMASNANHLTDEAAQRQTYRLSNAAPQNQTHNGGVWAKLETMARVWAHERGDLQVVTGPAHGGDQTMGPRAIPVPVAFWKVVVDVRTRETLAFLVPHEPLGWSTDVARFVVPLARVEEAAGLTLPRPGSVAMLDAAAPWPVDVTRADDLKAAACGR